MTPVVKKVASKDSSVIEMRMTEGKVSMPSSKRGKIRSKMSEKQDFIEKNKDVKTCRLNHLFF